MLIIIDEFAEIIMTGSNNFEYAIARLAALGRCVGIHLVLATQRLSIDAITVTIKNSFSSRIAFRVQSRIDSRLILDTGGAERLLGQGDMFFVPPGSVQPIRIHGSYISPSESRRLAGFIRNQGKPDYMERIANVLQEASGEFHEIGEKDEFYDEAVRLILHTGQASASYLQRKLKIGFDRASCIIDVMEMEGILGPSEGSKPREILADYRENKHVKRNSKRQ